MVDKIAAEDKKQTVEAALAIQPQLAIPMHYGAIVGDEGDALNFKKALEGKVEVLVLPKSWDGGTIGAFWDVLVKPCVKPTRLEESINQLR